METKEFIITADKEVLDKIEELLKPYLKEKISNSDYSEAIGLIASDEKDVN